MDGRMDGWYAVGWRTKKEEEQIRRRKGGYGIEKNVAMLRNIS